MSSQTKFKKDKEIIAEYEAQIKGEIRAGESRLSSPFLFLLLLAPHPPHPTPPGHHEMLLCIGNLIVRRNSAATQVQTGFNCRERWCGEYGL